MYAYILSITSISCTCVRHAHNMFPVRKVKSTSHLTAMDHNMIMGCHRWGPVLHSTVLVINLGTEIWPRPTGSYWILVVFSSCWVGFWMFLGPLCHHGWSLMNWLSNSWSCHGRNLRPGPMVKNRLSCWVLRFTDGVTEVFRPRAHFWLREHLYGSGRNLCLHALCTTISEQELPFQSWSLSDFVPHRWLSCCTLVSVIMRDSGLGSGDWEVYIYIYMYVCIYIYMYTYIHKEMHVCISHWTHILPTVFQGFRGKYRYRHTHRYTHIYIYIHIYIYTSTYISKTLPVCRCFERTSSTFYMGWNSWSFRWWVATSYYGDSLVPHWAPSCPWCSAPMSCWVLHWFAGFLPANS